MLDIIYEDNHIIVVIKPVGMPVQADKSGDMDLLTTVKLYIKEKYNKPGDVYLGLLHRLDRMVGGLIVFAKTSKAASRISKYIREKNFKKKYLAIVNGSIKTGGTLIDFLVKNERLNMSRVTKLNDEKAKEAILEYEPINTFTYMNKEYTRVLVDLKTGRHHQIRVQFANIDNPLYGDIKYGQKINKVGQKLALYSVYLAFYHPTKDEYLEFEVNPTDYVNDEIWRFES